MLFRFLSNVARSFRFYAAQWASSAGMERVMNHTRSRVQIARPRPIGRLTQAAVIATTLLVSGCMSAPHVQSTEAPSTPLASAVAAPPAQSGASALSYGAVTATVVRGKTTQSDLL